jgi:excisionase family DNA binding protein
LFRLPPVFCLFSKVSKIVHFGYFFPEYSGGILIHDGGTRGDGMEPYLTIRECAEVLRLSEQTIQRYVLNKEIPFLKIKKVIRFRPADVDRWAENGGRRIAAREGGNPAGDLFAAAEAGETGTESARPGEPAEDGGAAETGIAAEAGTGGDDSGGAA